MLNGKSLGFFGAGSMARAILDGLIEKQRTDRKKIFVINHHNQKRLSQFAQQYQLHPDQLQKEKVVSADIIFLAVKPVDLFDLLKEFGPKFHKGQCIISVAAGIRLECIEAFLQDEVAVIRTMPNTSSAIGQSATALAAGKWASEQDIELAKQIFSSMGMVLTIEEELMDAVTGLSGTGPAYFYYMVEAMEAAGVKVGLSQQDARKLTLQTILGAAHMLCETGQEAKQLREAVTSPNGTTMAALKVLKEYRFEEAIEQAVQKATERSAELGQEFSSKIIKV